MPLFFELASSLNVELVYIILKSITQFAYISICSEFDNDEELGKKKQVETIDIDSDTGDATLTLNKIKIKNSGSWQ